MLGDFEVTALSDGTLVLPMGSLLTHITAAQVKTQFARTGLDPGHVEGSVNAFLVHTGEHLVLVDAGAGHAFGPDAGGRLLNSLRAAGYRPEDIDAVLLTHVHGDHFSGMTADGKAVFPNADVYVDKNEADFWLDASKEKTVPEELRGGFAQAAARQRLKAMTDAAAKGYYVGAAHISFPGIGRVLPEGKAFTWLPVNYSVAGLKP